MRILCTCLLILLGLGIARAETPNDYAARWPLQTRGHAPVWQFEAGEQLHAALQDPGFGDLQVFNAAGEAVPTLRLAAPATSSMAAPQWLSARFASSGPAEGAAGDAGVMSYGYQLPAMLTVDAVRIRLGTLAASANVALQYRSGDDWITAARLTVTGADSAVSDEVRFPQAVTAHAWRLRSGMMLTPAPTLQVAARPVRFAFLAKGAGPFTLAVGSPVLRRREPVGAELTQLRGRSGTSGQPPLATVGTRTLAPFVAAVATVPDAYTWRPWLGGGLLLGIAGAAAAWVPRRRRPATASSDAAAA